MKHTRIYQKDHSNLVKMEGQRGEGVRALAMFHPRRQSISAKLRITLPDYTLMIPIHMREVP